MYDLFHLTFYGRMNKRVFQCYAKLVQSLEVLGQYAIMNSNKCSLLISELYVAHPTRPLSVMRAAIWV